LSVLFKENFRRFAFLSLFFLPLLVYSQQNDKELLKKTYTRLTAKKVSESVGGVIDVSDLKIGFLNDGRFCAPLEFVRSGAVAEVIHAFERSGRVKESEGAFMLELEGVEKPLVLNSLGGTLFPVELSPMETPTS